MIAITEIKNEKIRTEGVRVGTRLVQQLSTTFYPNPQIIFDELVSNAHDALADTVRIFIEKDKIVIDDNGEGMTPDGLVHFFYISHTTKEAERVRSFKDVKRAIIGKFGIGKLSLYQLCRSFEITTWRNGIESYATFNFDKFEKEEFIDSFELQVKSKETEKTGSGTSIRLTNLKREALGRLTAKVLANRLSKTMPLDRENFRIIIKDEKSPPIQITKEDIFGKKVAAQYDITPAQAPKVGTVSGTVIFFKKEDQTNQGIFVRVRGRIVNYDNPKGIINPNSISHPHMFTNKIRADINADGLDDVLLTNRAGFVEASEKYLAFVEWLKKRINSIGEEEYEKWQALKASIEKLEIPAAVMAAFDNSSTSMPELDKENAKAGVFVEQQPLSKRSPRSKSELPELVELIKKHKLKIELRELGIDGREAFFDGGSSTLVVNSSNPSYVFARSHGRLPGVAYHVFKTAVIVIALNSASTLEEFEHIYNSLSKNLDLLDSFHEALKRKK